jgi:hypothetical protein
VALGLDMDLGDQGAGGVDIDHLAAPASAGTDFRHAMGREDHGAVIRAFVQLLDEDAPRAFRRSTTWRLWTISWRT